MQQSEMDFGVYATAAANHARRRIGPPAPDRDGLFDLEGVTIICGRRQCAVEAVGELFVDVLFKERTARVTAIAPGKWDPVSILIACTWAHGNRVFEVDYATARPTNPGGLDEIRIARVVGADGIRPYLTKRSRYFESEHGVWAPVARLADAEGLRSFRRAPPGKPTWAFRTLLWGHGGPRTSDYAVRKALRALEDAGLVRIELGPRGGMATAKVTWTLRAYLAPERLDPDDEAAMEMLA
ncbi:hypothetical protein M2171_002563 [Bradyrhizobium japonicum USDA 38]|uniref:hypothetical protein n=1 Tax=Bradyrhizobium japonicum TaxID=375 RepID=UPI000400AE01|nr:hypothetical protein [Bradyrhizobium japonicum]MCS3893430.1 hypothetical protein [Bradyrhizobium japonicum USDA 38]MCS3945944.1 hypothetical protein [Bradyrhizobium japonicum]